MGVGTPREQTWPSLAARKRQGAIKREREAARLRAEADQLDRKWAAYVSRRDSRKAATGEKTEDADVSRRGGRRASA
jgi:hypothetical protein